MAMVTLLVAGMFVGCQAGPMPPDKQQQNIISDFNDYSSRSIGRYDVSGHINRLPVDGHENLVEPDGNKDDVTVSDGEESSTKFFGNMVYRNHELKAVETFTAPSQTAFATTEDHQRRTKEEHQLDAEEEENKQGAIATLLKTVGSSAVQRGETGKTKKSGVTSALLVGKATGVSSKYTDQRFSGREILSKKTDQVKTKVKTHLVPTRPSPSSAISTSSYSPAYSSYASLAPPTTTPTSLSSYLLPSSSSSSLSSSYSSLSPHHRQKRFIGNIRSIAVPISIFNYLGYLPIRVPGLPYHIDPPPPDYTVYRAVHHIPVRRPFYVRRRRRY